MKIEKYFFFTMLDYQKYILKLSYNNLWNINVIKGEDSFKDFKYILSDKCDKEDVYDYLNEYFDTVCEIDESEISDFFSDELP